MENLHQEFIKSRQEHHITRIPIAWYTIHDPSPSPGAEENLEHGRNCLLLPFSDSEAFKSISIFFKSEFKFISLAFESLCNLFKKLLLFPPTFLLKHYAYN